MREPWEERVDPAETTVSVPVDPPPPVPEGTPSRWGVQGQMDAEVAVGQAILSGRHRGGWVVRVGAALIVLMFLALAVGVVISAIAAGG